jgi:hypothetical protein
MGIFFLEVIRGAFDQGLAPELSISNPESMPKSRGICNKAIIKVDRSRATIPNTLSGY